MILVKDYFSLAQAITLPLFMYGKIKTSYIFVPELQGIIFNLEIEIYDF